MKAPALGLTVAGAGLGLLGGPIGLAVGAGLGLLGDRWRHRHRALHPLTEHHLRSLRRAAPHLDDSQLQAKAIDAGQRPPIEARALLGLLKRAGRHRANRQFWHDGRTRKLVAAFQNAFNKDANAQAGLGSLEVSGRFDPATSAALALYVHETVSPDPAATGGDS